MTIITIGAVAASALACVVGYRRRRNARYLWLVLILAALTFAAALSGRLRLTLQVTLFDLVPLVGAGLLVADAVGLPRIVVTRTRWGLHSREWEYDRWLFRRLERMHRKLAQFPSESEQIEAWTRSVIAEGEKLHGDLRAKRPPDDDWAQLAADYVELHGLVIADIRTHGGAWHRADIDAAGAALTIRWNALRAKYRRAARDVLGGPGTR